MWRLLWRFCGGGGVETSEPTPPPVLTLPPAAAMPAPSPPPPPTTIATPATTTMIVSVAATLGSMATVSTMASSHSSHDLHEAAVRGDVTTVTRVVTSRRMSSAVMSARKKYTIESVEMMLSPLALAAWHGQVDVIHSLVAAGAVVGAYHPSYGTALHLAARAGHVAAVQALLHHADEAAAAEQVRAASPAMSARTTTPSPAAGSGGLLNASAAWRRLSGVVAGPTSSTKVTPSATATAATIADAVVGVAPSPAAAPPRHTRPPLPTPSPAAASVRPTSMTIVTAGPHRLSPGPGAPSPLHATTSPPLLISPTHAGATSASAAQPATPVHAMPGDTVTGVVEVPATRPSPVPLVGRPGSGDWAVLVPRLTNLPHAGVWDPAIPAPPLRGHAVGQMDGDGWLPLHHAASRGHVAVLDALLDHPVGALLLDTPTAKAHGTALHLAAQHDCLPVVQSLLRRGADLTVRNVLGETPFLTSCKGHSLPTVEALWLAGSDAYARDRNGQTALHLSERRSEAVLTFLLDVVGMPVNLRDSSGETPLHSACAHHGMTKAMELLLDRGADLGLADWKGQTPLSRLLTDRNTLGLEIVTARGLVTQSPQRTTVFNPRSQWRKVLHVIRVFAPKGAWVRRSIVVVAWAQQAAATSATTPTRAGAGAPSPPASPSLG